MGRKRERRCRRNGRAGDEGGLCPVHSVSTYKINELYRFYGLTVETSHNLIDLSSEPEARVWLSGDQAIVEMPARWPSNVCRCLPVVVSQILMDASAADWVSWS